MSEGRLPEPPESTEQQLREELRAREEVIDGLRAALSARQDALTAIESSVGWKLIRRARAWRDRLLAPFPRLRSVVASRRLVGADAGGAAYGRWLDAHTPTVEALGAMRAEAAHVDGPLFSLVLRSLTGDRALLARTLQTLAAQAWQHFNVVLPPNAEGERALVAEALGDARRVRQAGPLTDEGGWGDYVAFLVPGDELAPHALYRVAAAIQAGPVPDVVYSDEDRIDAAGRRVAPFFKPNWSPHLLLSWNYLGQLAMYRRTLLSEVGAGIETGSYDLALRATEQATRIVHVSDVLYHARPSPDPKDVDRGRRILEAALSRRGLAGQAEPVPGVPTYRPTYRVRYALIGTPRVSIIIPTKDHATLLRACVASVEQRSTWPHREIIIVDNGSTCPAAVRLTAELARRHQVLRDPRPFNWAALNNAATARAKGDYLLFLNDDTEVLSPGWIEALLEQAQQDDVGAVGAKLLYPDGTVQHAGIALGIGVAGHVFRGLPGDAPGYHGLAMSVRDVSAVTGACLMVRRAVFQALGGFDEGLPVAYNDVDFCLRVRQRGLSVVWTPHATLLHRESATRGTLDPPAAQALMWERWCTELARDPFYSPHLTRSREDYGVRG